MKLLLKTLLATALLTVGLSASAQIIDQLPLDDNVAENHSKTVSADNGHLWIDGDIQHLQQGQATDPDRGNHCNNRRDPARCRNRIWPWRPLYF